jgi:lysophospholipase L1-like esterase
MAERARKTILCYGDSLTWGYDPDGPSRHGIEDRWPSVLEAGLGGSVNVVAEGLNGRTTAFDDYLSGADRNGARVLPTVLESHSPLDLVVIMLGSNDMKPWVHGHPLPARQGMARLIGIVRGHAYPLDAEPPDVLIVSPPPLAPTQNVEFAEMFGHRLEASRQLASQYSALAEELGCGFFDAGSVATSSALDGVHLDAESSRAIGEALAPIVRVMLEL